MRRLTPAIVIAAMSVVWTWPLVLHLRSHIPGPAGNNSAFLWNLWWMRKALSSPELSFFRSPYVFSPFGIDLINRPHHALGGLVTASLMAMLPLVTAANLYIIGSVFLTGMCAYALAIEIGGDRRASVFAGIALGGSSYIAAHHTASGDFQTLSVWVVPLFALFFRRALATGTLVAAVAAGLTAAASAYSCFGYTIFIAVFAICYTAVWTMTRARTEPIWKGIQALTLSSAACVLACLPLIVQMFRLVVSGRDGGGLVLGHPFHPVVWLGAAPMGVLAIRRSDRWKRRFWIAGLLATGLLLAIDYLPAPIPLTALDHPAVYDQLAAIADNAPVIEVPLAFGDARVLYHATIHGHPLVGGYIGTMPPGVVEAYQAMPVVGNLLRLSGGGESVEEPAPPALPFKYLVLDTTRASVDLRNYLKSTLDMDLIASGDGRELYAVQGVRPPNLRAAA